MKQRGIDEALYERLLVDYEARAVAFLERGQGREQGLMREAEDLLALREQFPETFQRHARVEGLVAEMIARRRQRRVLGGAERSADSPGCLFGWLLARPRGD